MRILFSSKSFFISFSIFFLFVLNINIAFSHQSENLNEVIIHVDENGFEPNKINIKLGTRVIFENIGKEEHWPASDDHPSHTLYSGTSLGEHCNDDSFRAFDSCGPVKPKQSWSFVFEKVGTHGYHDHLWPHLVGEIIVEDLIEQENERKKYIYHFLDFFRKMFFIFLGIFIDNNKNISLDSGNIEAEFYATLKNKYKGIVVDLNPKEAIRALQNDSEKDNKISAFCHDMLHVIGHTAFDKYGGFKEAIKYQSDFCNSGYIHGLFEAYFKSTSNPIIGLSNQCSDYASNKRLFDLWQCYHGIGHGFMYFTGGDLDESLELCKKSLVKGSVESCYNGVFMEVFNSEILAKEKSFVDPKNPFSTCSERSKAKADCYLYVPTYLSQTLEMDFLDIFRECDRAEFGYKSSCIQGVGSEAIKRNMSKTNDVFALCEQAGSFNNQEACVVGVVGMYMNQEGSHSSGERLCKSAPSNYIDFCEKAVNNSREFFK